MKPLQLFHNPRFRLVKDVLFALGNSVLGLFTRSWWFVTVGVYYAVLAVARFAILWVKRKAAGDVMTEMTARRVSGWLLMALSLCLVGINILAGIRDRGKTYHEIVVIAIACYTFAKITRAVVGMVQARRQPSPVVGALRNIALADACVSVYSLQRSMLVSFPGMGEGDILLMNMLTGTAAWLIVLFLGINLLGGRYVTMAKSKLAQATSKMADATAKGYKKIETGVVDGYKKIEKGVVDGYKKVEDKFVDLYLTKDGETVEEAKERLKREKP